MGINEREADRIMDEKKLSLLKMALKMGETALDEVYHTAEYCDDMRNDYCIMVEELAKILGLEYNDLV